MYMLLKDMLYFVARVPFKFLKIDIQCQTLGFNFFLLLTFIL